MDTQYFLAVLVAFLGLSAGMIIAYFAKEEIKPGTKYLKIFSVALVLLSVVAVSVPSIELQYRVIIYVLLILILLFMNKSEIIYPFLGAVFFLASENGSLLLVSGLIFLYGLPAGSLALKNYNKKEFLKINARHAGFFIVAIAFSLISF